MSEPRRLEPSVWEIPVGYVEGMRVPGVVFASDELFAKAVEDGAVEQVANVATLPGIVGASYAMPDIHWGYGFPIGGVAATDPADGGVVSPGGVGFDIGCGVRLLRSDLDWEADARAAPACCRSTAPASTGSWSRGSASPWPGGSGSRPTPPPARTAAPCPRPTRPRCRTGPTTAGPPSWAAWAAATTSSRSRSSTRSATSGPPRPWGWRSARCA